MEDGVEEGVEFKAGLKLLFAPRDRDRLLVGISTSVFWNIEDFE